MIGRRSFLKAFGVTPLAAKAAAEKTMADLTMRSWMNPALAQGRLYGRGDTPASASGEAGINLPIARAKYLQLMGTLPDHIDQMYREQAKHVIALDPDLASKRSWSFCVKVQEQRQRNYERTIAGIRTEGTWELAKKTFRSVSGFDWSW